MTSDDLFQANLRVFAERLPELHQRLSRINRPLSKVVTDGDAVVDIHLQSGLLYKSDAREVASKQVAAFVERPYRTNYNVPSSSAGFDSLISRRVFEGLMRSLRDHAVGTLPVQINTTSGHLIIFGIGLGYHLPQLVDAIKTRHVIVYEPFEEFLLHSLRAIDWGALFEACDRDGRRLHVACESDPQIIAEDCARIFNSDSPTLLDGSYIYDHYPLWNLAEARRRITNDLPRQMIVRGYFEDERKMICNTATNLHRTEFRLLEGRLRPRGNVPVFLIGAGPSFDDAAEFVRQWRNHAIIISSGSALQPLLKYGVVPDFHTEMENDPCQYDKIKHIVDSNADLFPSGKLTGITLVASSTLNPRVIPFFDEVFYFFRDSTTSTATFGRGWAPLVGSAPTVANTSMVAAACMGFGEVYLFGYDCGWRDGKDHHAKDTIYYTTDTFKTEEMAACYTVRGNFGGEFQSDMIFDWSKNMLEQAIRAYYMRAFNCSDGALIEGAVPKVPEALEFTEELDRPALLAKIRDDSPHFLPGTFFAGFDPETYANQLKEYVAEVDAIIDRAVAGGVDFADFLDEAWPRINGMPQNHGMAGLLSCTTAAELKQAALFINRVPTPEERRKVSLDFLRHLKDLHREMLDEALTILDEADRMFRGQCDPEWTKGLPTTSSCSY